MLSPLVVLGVLLYLFSGNPFFPRLPTASDQPNGEGEKELSDEDMASTNISKSPSAVPPMPAAEKVEADSPSQASQKVRPANDTPIDQQRMIAAQQAFAKIHKKIDGESERLKKFGGNAWLQMQSLLDAATVARSPAKVASLADQASQLLEATLPEIDIAELLATIRGDNPVDAIEKLIAFREQYPDHPRLSELGNVVAEVGHKGWLKWAASEMEACSPDSAAFFEAWLPIASAWSIFGEQAEQREAMRRAREAIPRLTSP